MSSLVTLAEVKTFLGIPNTTTYPAVVVNLTVNTSLSKITRASGNWATDGVNVGSTITFAGFLNAGNNILVTVASVLSATEITLASVVGMTSETGTGTSFQKSAVAGNTVWDDFLNSQITVISDAIETYCRRIFAQATYEQTFYNDELLRVTPTPELKLFQYPLISITSVNIGDPPDELITEYRIQKEVGILYRKCGWVNLQDIEVIYVAGFATIPSLIKDVALNLIQERYNKKKAGVDLNFGSNVQQVSVPGVVSLTFDYTLSRNDIKSALGMIIGDYANVLDQFKSERAVLGDVRGVYLA